MSETQEPILPADVPLYPGFGWLDEFGQEEEGAQAIVIESGYFKGAAGPEVEAFYLDWLEKDGWEAIGPAGGSTSWTLSGTKEKRACRVYFTLNEDFDTAAELSPRGARLRIVHWDNGPF